MQYHDRSALPIGTILRAHDEYRGGHVEYRIRKYLSLHGGTALVYLASSVPNNQAVVIKELFPFDGTYRLAGHSMISHKGSMFSQLEMYFQRELNILKQLVHKDCHTAAKLISCFRSNGTLYYAMPYEDGKSLHDMPEELSSHQIKKLLSDILRLLESMRTRGIVHADIKPANILYVQHDAFVLIDFGASRFVYNNQNNAGIQFPRSYSPGFAAPEQLENRFDQIDYSTDVYCLAATIFYLLSGRKFTFDYHDVEASMRKLLLNTQLNKEYTPQFFATLKKALSPHITERFTNAQTWIDVLDLSVPHGPHDPPDPPDLDPEPPTLLVRIIILIFLILIAIIALLSFSRTASKLGSSHAEIKKSASVSAPPLSASQLPYALLSFN